MDLGECVAAFATTCGTRFGVDGPPGVVIVDRGTSQDQRCPRVFLEL